LGRKIKIEDAPLGGHLLPARKKQGIFTVERGGIFMFIRKVGHSEGGAMTLNFGKGGGGVIGHAPVLVKKRRCRKRKPVFGRKQKQG